MNNVLTALLCLSGCAFTAEDVATPNQPRGVNAHSLGYGVFLPSCLLFCVATGQASQAEHGDAQAGDLTTNTEGVTLSPHNKGVVKPKMKPRMLGKH